MLRHELEKFGEFYLTCSTHLFQKLTDIGVMPWWRKAQGEPKGLVIFCYYDTVTTCLRLLPTSPRIFQASTRSGSISYQDAELLNKKLVETLSKLLLPYAGFFQQELRKTPLSQIFKKLSEPDEFGLYEAHQRTGPDEFYANFPWPLLPALHFPPAIFLPAGFRQDYIKTTIFSPLRAATIALDLVTHGPGLNLRPADIISVLDWLTDDPSGHPFPLQDSQNLKKIVIPAYSGGLQGIAFGMFKDLPVAIEPKIAALLTQFVTTVGEALARERENTFLGAKTSGLHEYALSYLRIVPPLEHIIFLTRSRKIGFKITKENDYLSGYVELTDRALSDAISDPLNYTIKSEEHDNDIGIRVKAMDGMDGLSSLFTLLRIYTPATSFKLNEENAQITPLGRSDIGAALHGLRRQVAEGRGANAASKKIFLLDCVLQNYSRAQVTLTNQKSRDYIENILGKGAGNYHITGKASKKFENDVQKLLPNCFVFEQVSAHAIRVRWQPKESQHWMSQSAEGPRTQMTQPARMLFGSDNT